MISTELVAPKPGSAPKCSDFSYDALEPNVVAEAQAAAARIHKLGCQQTDAILGIGRELLGIKTKIGHRHWLAWLRAEFDMSLSTAERYMRLAEKLPDKIVTVTNLKPTTLYSLAAKSTPAPVREAIVSRIESGEALSDQEIRKLVTQASTARAAERQVEKQTAAEPADKASDKAIQREHQEVVLAMLCGAFDNDDLRGFADHLVYAGWAASSAEQGLLQAIKSVIAKTDAAEISEPTADNESFRSTTAAPHDVPDLAVKAQPAAQPNELSAAPNAAWQTDTFAQCAEQQPSPAMNLNVPTMEEAVENGSTATAAGTSETPESDDDPAAPPDMVAVPIPSFAPSQPGSTVEEQVGSMIDGEYPSGPEIPEPATTATTSLASATDQASVQPSPLGARFAKVWSDCKAPGNTCRYSHCRPGEGGCGAVSVVEPQAA